MKNNVIEWVWVQEWQQQGMTSDEIWWQLFWIRLITVVLAVLAIAAIVAIVVGIVKLVNFIKFKRRLLKIRQEKKQNGGK